MWEFSTCVEPHKSIIKCRLSVSKELLLINCRQEMITFSCFSSPSWLLFSEPPSSWKVRKLSHDNYSHDAITYLLNSRSGNENNIVNWGYFGPKILNHPTNCKTVGAYIEVCKWNKCKNNKLTPGLVSQLWNSFFKNNMGGQSNPSVGGYNGQKVLAAGSDLKGTWGKFGHLLP